MQSTKQQNIQYNKNCSKCILHQTRTNIVIGKGDLNSKILFIGEAPGKNEDLKGEPFVGSAGKRLNEFLKNINLDLNKIYITNILKCRPPKNRNPKKEEILACTPYLLKQIEEIKPKIICTLGNYSTKYILSNFQPKNMNKIQGISKIHGKIHTLKTNKININYELKIIPFYHPAATLYNPKLIPELKKDFLTLKQELKNEKSNNK